MLEHLITGEPSVLPTHQPEGFVPLARAEAADVLDGQIRTADWLAEMGLTEAQTTTEDEKTRARAAFGALVEGQSDEHKVAALMDLHTPASVRHITGMLTAYDWEFVAQAKQLRGYVVAQLVQESQQATKAGDRIKALTALGKVTEVGLFTEKVEVTKKDLTAEEIDKRLKEKLAKFMGVVDSTPKPVPQITDVDSPPANSE
jgi:hypothetical protein